jgi:predicted RND superfamily exporter protein
MTDSEMLQDQLTSAGSFVASSAIDSAAQASAYAIQNMVDRATGSPSPVYIQAANQYTSTKTIHTILVWGAVFTVIYLIFKKR